MSGEATSLLQQVLNLPSNERYEIAQQVLNSLGDDEAPDDPEYWNEIERRSDEAHAHPERLLDAKQVIADLREHLRRRREG